MKTTKSKLQKKDVHKKSGESVSMERSLLLELFENELKDIYWA